MPAPRVERLEVRRRLLRKLEHDEFRERARDWARRVRDGVDWKTAAEACGLRIAAARALRCQPDVMDTLIAEETPRPMPMARLSTSAVEVEAARPVDHPVVQETISSDEAWMRSLPPVPYGWSDAQWRQLWTIRRALAARWEAERARAAFQPRRRSLRRC